MTVLRKNFFVSMSGLKNTVVLVFAFLFFAPCTAYAYLDPGTGNILVYVFVSLLGALLYSLKGFYWFIRGKNTRNSYTEHKKILIFCEGKSYWNTFKPIVMALMEKKTCFSYYSMDVEDPGLTIENELMCSRYIGEGSAAFARVCTERPVLMLATTPNIGTPGFPMPRPSHVKKLIHVCHGIDDIGLYKKGSLDHYDVVLLVGAFMTRGIRYLENLRGLQEKELVLAGLPYFDDLASKMKYPRLETDGNTILISPSWGTKGCLSEYGSDFIRLLADAHFKVILRPHPQSWKIEREMLEKIKKDLRDYENILWDKENDGALAMEVADVLISDTSNIRMDFALLYERPVITLKMNIPDLETFEVSDMDTVWMQEAETKIGIVINKEEVKDIVSFTKKLIQEKQSADFSYFRSENVCNFKQSGQFIADYLIRQGNEYEVLQDGI